MRISDWSSDVCSSDLPDMRMRSDIGVAKLIGRQMQRTGMIEEDERPDHAALPKGQNALDGKAAAKIGQIGRAHVCTPVTNAQLVCRLLLETKNTTKIYCRVLKQSS